MRLTDLHPQWLGHGGEHITRNGVPVPHRERVGVTFDCPCGAPDSPVMILFRNPEDGQGPVQEPAWERAGNTFDTLTLSPSILRRVSRCGCGWHGYVTNGEVTSV